MPNSCPDLLHLVINSDCPLNLSEDQILTLAPDDSSRKSGKDLANPSKWVTKAISGRAIWGECQGSGSKPYQTQADLSDLAFKCSCPSRKFPCKHGLGLLLLYARQPASFTTGGEPGWVSEWIEKRAGKAEQTAAKKESGKPVDEAAQQKRQQTRQQRVKDGMSELLLWIKDIVRNGLLQMPEKPPAFWENMARRMVDAQAPGLAAMVRNLGETNFYQDGWQSLFLDQLLRIYMVITGFQNLSTDTAESAGDLTAEPTILDDISGYVGFTVTRNL